jgi:hypothetical protein
MKKHALPIVEGPNDLLPLAHPRLLGLPFSRRTLGKRIADGSFTPPIVKLGGRLHVCRGPLEEYKAKLAGISAAE